MMLMGGSSQTVLEADKYFRLWMKIFISLNLLLLLAGYYKKICLVTTSDNY
jgi:hypothetical protein